MKTYLPKKCVFHMKINCILDIVNVGLANVPMAMRLLLCRFPWPFYGTGYIFKTSYKLGTYELHQELSKKSPPHFPYKKTNLGSIDL